MSEATANPIDFTRAYRQHLEQERIKTGKVAAALVVFLMPAGISLDYFVYPEKVGEFLLLRLACSFLAAIIWFLHFLPFGRRYLQYLSLPIALLPAISIAVMIYRTEGLTSPYYAGLNLILLAVSVVVHWELIESLIAVGCVIGVYLVACMLASLAQVPANAGALFFNNMYFLLLTGIIVVTGNTFYSRLRRSEFSLRFELNQNKQKLEESNEKLIELNQVKDRFFANISHELRTPLTLLLAPLETLLYRYQGHLEHEARELLKGMQANAMRLLKLINDLLDLVRLESGRLEAKKDPLDLELFVGSLQNATNQVAQDKQIDLRCEVEPDLGIVVADRDKLEKVFLNLLFNALKFTPERGRVHLTGRREGDQLVFQVKDSGIGIAKKNLAHIFDRFWQADGSAKRKYQGVGIGLSLVKELVEVQGGRVDVNSEEGRGTEFTIHLPFVPGEESQLISMDKENGQGAGHPGDGLTPGMQSQEWISDLYRRAELLPGAADQRADGDLQLNAGGGEKQFTVLMADDEPHMRGFLRSQLKNAYNIIEAVDGQEAVEKAVEAVPDLILLDLMMPRKDGLQACQELRQQEALRAVPIILLTARADEEAKLNTLAAGASDFLSKPFSTTELQVRIKNLLVSGNYQRQLGRKNQELENTIQQLKETELQLVQSEKMASLGRLSAGIIHEINNPLNFTSTGLFTLKKIGAHLPEARRPEFDEILGDVEEGMSRVKHIVSDLRAFTHPGKVNLKPVNVAGVVRTSLRFVSNQVGEDMDVDLEIPEDLEVRAHRSRLIQVILNLLQNSIDSVKKNAPESDKPTIRISAGVSGERIYIAVRDNGGGIEAEKLDKIFDPFFTTKDVGEGMGLGLSICYRIMKQFDGTMRVESQAGEYCRMILEFPVHDREPTPSAPMETHRA